jgi:hypothetical protein
MRLIIVSGLSGSGKSVALNMLEDLDYYCVDNIPAGLLPGFIAYTVRTSEPAYRLTAVGVDASDLDDVRNWSGLRRSASRARRCSCAPIARRCSSASAKRGAGIRSLAMAWDSWKPWSRKSACWRRSPMRPT